MTRRIAWWERGTISVPFRFTVWVEESSPTWMQENDRTWDHPTVRAVHARPVTVWALNHIRAGEKVRRREGINEPLGRTR